MLKHNEDLINFLVEEARYKGLPLYQIVADYTDENDIEPDVLIKEFDDNFINRVRESAINNVPFLKQFNVKKIQKVDTSFFFEV